MLGTLFQESECMGDPWAPAQAGNTEGFPLPPHPNYCLHPFPGDEARKMGFSLPDPLEVTEMLLLWKLESPIIQGAEG